MCQDVQRDVKPSICFGESGRKTTLPASTNFAMLVKGRTNSRQHGSIKYVELAVNACRLNYGTYTDRFIHHFSLR